MVSRVGHYDAPVGIGRYPSRTVKAPELAARVPEPADLDGLEQLAGSRRLGVRLRQRSAQAVGGRPLGPLRPRVAGKGGGCRRGRRLDSSPARPCLRPLLPVAVPRSADGLDVVPPQRRVSLGRGGVVARIRIRPVPAAGRDRAVDARIVRGRTGCVRQEQHKAAQDGDVPAPAAGPRPPPRLLGLHPAGTGHHCASATGELPVPYKDCPELGFMRVAAPGARRACRTCWNLAPFRRNTGSPAGACGPHLQGFCGAAADAAPGAPVSGPGGQAAGGQRRSRLVRRTRAGRPGPSSLGLPPPALLPPLPLFAPWGASAPRPGAPALRGQVSCATVIFAPSCPRPW